MLIELFADGWLDDLCKRAFDLAVGQHLHLLIDGAFVPGLHRTIPPERKIMLFSTLPGCSDAALDLSSFLIGFDPDDSSTLRLLKRCSGWPMVSVIQTQEEMSALAARMAAWTVIEADGQHFHLRYADARRIPAIVRTLDASQRAQFLGPATHWTCITRSGAWQVLELEGIGADIAVAPSLDARQFGLLVEDSRIDEMLALFTRRHPGPATPAMQGYDLLAVALQVAARERLTEQELLGWCESLWREGQVETTLTASKKFVRWQAMRQIDGNGKER